MCRPDGRKPWSPRAASPPPGARRTGRSPAAADYWGAPARFRPRSPKSCRRRGCSGPAATHSPTRSAFAAPPRRSWRSLCHRDRRRPRRSGRNRGSRRRCAPRRGGGSKKRRFRREPRRKGSAAGISRAYRSPRPPAPTRRRRSTAARIPLGAGRAALRRSTCGRRCVARSRCRIEAFRIGHKKSG